MRILKTTVESCEYCPYNTQLHTNAICVETGAFIDADEFDLFPNWCPLFNEEEDDEQKLQKLQTHG